jgi:hypothetical protein
MNALRAMQKSYRAKYKNRQSKEKHKQIYRLQEKNKGESFVIRLILCTFVAQNN